MDTRWHIAVAMDDWLVQARAWVSRAEAQALAQGPAFHLVLAGGSTPQRLYEALAREPHDWHRWHIWFSDERCLPPEHPERNHHLATPFSRIPPDHIHVIPGELGAEAAAHHYADDLSGQVAFDLVLLGLGEDGHTASLFPGQAWGEQADAQDALPVHGAPKPPPDRVSLSARRLSRARQVLFLVTGAGKREAVARWRAGDAIPASAIRPAGGVDVLLTTESCPPGVLP